MFLSEKEEATTLDKLAGIGSVRQNMTNYTTLTI